MIYFILGSCFGSFLCVVAERVPISQPFIIARSRCVNCKRVLSFWEMIPILSSLLLKFQCRTCHKRISVTYFITEILYGLIFLLSFKQQTTIDCFITLYWLTVVLLLTLTDIYYLVIEPKIFYPSHLTLIAFLFYFNFPFYWESLVLYLIICSFILLFLNEALGMGDLLLLLFWAPWLSPHELIQLLFIASLTALLTYAIIFLTTSKKVRTLQLPFVPFLNLGLIVAHFL